MFAQRASTALKVGAAHRRFHLREHESTTCKWAYKYFNTTWSETFCYTNFKRGEVIVVTCVWMFEARSKLLFFTIFAFSAPNAPHSQDRKIGETEKYESGSRTCRNGEMTKSDLIGCYDFKLNSYERLWNIVFELQLAWWLGGLFLPPFWKSRLTAGGVIDTWSCWLSTLSPSSISSLLRFTFVPLLISLYRRYLTPPSSTAVIPLRVAIILMRIICHILFAGPLYQI